MFTEAFERLKANKPIVLPIDTPVSQNNVAREAGRDPSALKKDRYPILIEEIQAFVRVRQEQDDKQKTRRDNRTRTTQQKLKDRQAQVEKLTSIVAAQDNYIAQLLDEIEELKARKVNRLEL